MCKFDGCEKPVRTMGYCGGHYKQHNKGKELTPLLVKHYNIPLEDRIKLYTVVTDSGCWEWTGAKNNKGYGFTTASSEHGRLAHRASYATFVGPIEETDVIHHTCANNACVNPKHLQKLGMHENTAEMLERKYYKKQIRELTALVKRLQRQLSKCKCEVKT